MADDWTDGDYEDLSRYDLAESERGDAYLVKPWSVAHAEQNPGHRTVARLNQPDRCETCGEKSPMAGLLAQSFSVAPPESVLSEDVMIALRETLDTINRRLPPMPKRIEMTLDIYDALKHKVVREADERERLGIHPDPPWTFGGIPVVVKDDVPPPGWRLVKRPEIGDPCVRCGKPTSHDDFMKNDTQIAHVFCPEED